MTLNEYLNKPGVAEWWASVNGRNIGEGTFLDGLPCSPVYKDGDSVVVFPHGNCQESQIAVPVFSKLKHLALDDIPGTGGMLTAHAVVDYLHKAACDVLHNRGSQEADTIEQTLKERGARYGTFAQNGALYHALKTLLTTEKASTVQQMCLDMIAMKLSRMINGDINYRDNWVDIIGYCKGALGEGDE